ncbi:Bifunctional hemolysin/adenylate cyclase precursor [Blastopirellula retiformator]|uniref:Bifunctional hemolysin/adenylate cyclase n=2 Tax=Blastopirellula retiformator TaxID=2527970 RepID=A0A5C5VAM5_9BACT|nr:Bifunctional hemolysin/adenylate cyclase precursor [Blastopirellula retiformator]
MRCYTGWVRLFDQIVSCFFGRRALNRVRRHRKSWYETRRLGYRLHRPSSEKLEERVVFSTTPFSEQGGVLSIQGTNLSDNILVYASSTVMIDMGPDTFDTGISLQDLTSIQAFAGDGDDTVKIDPSMGTLSARLYGQAGNDTLISAAGADQVFGGTGDDLLNGGSGNDSLIGDDGADELRGGEGDDTLRLDSEDTVLDGGAGRDSANARNSAIGVVIDMTAGNFEIAYGSDFDDTISAAGLSERAIIYGYAGKDLLTGSDYNDSISGGDGDDILVGGEGNDSLSGNAGADELSGNGGDDTLYLDADDVLLDGGAGRDSANARSAVTGVNIDMTARNFEIAYGSDFDDTISAAGLSERAIIYGYAGKDLLTGSDYNDSISGGDGDDILVGGEGNDSLSGNAGADELSGNGGDDTLYLDADDVLLDGGAGRDSANARNSAIGVVIDMTAGSFEIAYGSDFDDKFYVTASDQNILIYGYNGSDFFHVSPLTSGKTITLVGGDGEFDGLRVDEPLAETSTLISTGATDGRIETSGGFGTVNFSQIEVAKVLPTNTAPTMSLADTVTTLAATTDTSQRILVAEILVSDDGVGSNQLSLIGDDAALFEIDGDQLFLQAGVSLSFSSNPVLDVTVQVDDATVGGSPDDVVALAIAIEAPPLYPAPELTGPELFPDTTTPTITWNAVPAASEYRVFIRDEATNLVVLSEVVNGVEYVVPNALAVGYYLVEVRSADATGELGAPGTPRRFFAGRGTSQGVIDNGDPGFTASAGFVNATDTGAHDDDQAVAPTGSTGETAHWAFDAQPGVYRVDVTWNPSASLGTVQYWIYDGGTSELLDVVTIDQTSTPADTSSGDGTLWATLGTYQLTSESLVVQLVGDAAHDVAADAVQMTPVTSVTVAATPELTLSLAGEELMGGIVNFGVVSQSSSVQRTIRVANTGGSDLVVQPVIAPSGFSILSNFTAGQVISAGSYADLVVQIDAGSSGYRDGTLNLTSNDNGSPASLRLLGGVQGPFVAIVDDDDDANFTPFDASDVDIYGPIWVVADRPDLPVYVDSDGVADYHFAYGQSELGEMPSEAVWTFSNLQPGTYRVWGTWRPFSSRTTNASYTLEEGDGQTVGTATADQTATPNDLNDAGVAWETLTDVTIVGNTLVVKLATDYFDRVTADAIRIESLSGGGSQDEGVETIDLTLNGSAYDGTDPIEFNTTLGSSASHTVTLTNNGSGPLILQPVGALPAGFTVTSNIAANTVLAPGQSASLTINFEPTATGHQSGSLTIPLNVNGSSTGIGLDFVAQTPLDLSSGNVWTVDDQDSGFTIIDSGNFGNDYGQNTGPGQGFEESYWITSSNPPLGFPVTFQWDFTGLTPGAYRIWATWQTREHRTSEADYTIESGAETYQATADQSQTPNGFLQDGVWWQQIGPDQLTVEGSTVRIKLSDDAGGSVAADAIRLERIQPIAVSDTFEKPFGSPTYTLDVLANDSQEGTIQIVGTPNADGSVSISGGRVYAYANGTVGVQLDSLSATSLSFQYTVTAGSQTSAPAQVSLNLIALRPIAVADQYELSHGYPLTFDVRANDADPQGDRLSVRALSSPAFGTLEFIADDGDGSVASLPSSAQRGVFRYTPDATHWEEHGDYTVSFQYEVSDGQSTSIATATLQVTNSTPTFEGLDRWHVPGGNGTGAQIISKNDAIRFYDGDADELQIEARLAGSSTWDYNRLSLDENGWLTFDAGGINPANTSTGTNFIDIYYRVTDGHSVSEARQMTILVHHEQTLIDAIVPSIGGVTVIEQLASIAAFNTYAELPTVVYIAGAEDTTPGFVTRQVEEARNAYQENLGEVNVALASGSVSVAHGLDLNLGPAGDDFAITYNSDTTAPRPIIEAILDIPAGGRLDGAKIKFIVDDTGNSSPGSGGVFSQFLSNISETTWTESELDAIRTDDGRYVFRLQTADPINGIGPFDYRVEIEATLEGGATRQLEAVGVVTVHDRDDASERVFGGFARGWTLSGLTRLYAIQGVSGVDDSRLAIVMPDGQHREFKALSDPQTGEPTNRYVAIDSRYGLPLAEELGRLIKNGDGTYTYTTAAGMRYQFDSERLLTEIEPLSGPSIAFTYDASKRIETIANTDGSISTFVYNGDYLDRIETGDRVIDIAIVGDELRQITDDGRVREFQYNSQGDLASVSRVDSTQALTTSVAYNTDTGLVRSVTVGEAEYLITPLAAVNLKRPDSAESPPENDPSGNTIQIISKTQLATVVSPTRQGDDALQRYDEPTKAGESLNYSLKTDYGFDDEGRILTRISYADTAALIDLADPADPQSIAILQPRSGVGGAAVTVLGSENWRRNDHGDVVSYVDPLGRETLTTYDYDISDGKAFGNVVRQFADYQLAEFEYEAQHGLLISEVDSRGAITRYTYDDQIVDFITRIDGPEGQLGLFTPYRTGAKEGLVLGSIDSRGLATVYEYDAQLRISTVTSAAASIEVLADPSLLDEIADLRVDKDRMQTTYSYDTNGNVDVVTEKYSEASQGFVVRSVRDEDHRESGDLQSVRIEDGQGKVLSHKAYAYYDNGLLKAEGVFLTPPADESSLTSDNPLTAADSDVILTSYEYDSRGQLSKVSQEADAFVFDPATGQPTFVARPELVTQYEFFVDGSAKSVQDADGSVTENFYDPIAMTYWTKQSGVAGELMGTSTESVESVTRLQSDAIGRTLQIDDLLSGAHSTSLYDRQDRLTSRIAQTVLSGENLKSLDDLNVSIANLTTIFSYDAGGNLLQQASEDQAPVSYSFDQAGRLIAVQTVTSNSVVAQGEFGRGLLLLSSYTPAGDLASTVELRTTVDPQNNLVIRNDFEYDVFGRTTKQIDAGKVDATTPRGVTSLDYRFNMAAYPGLLEVISIDRYGVETKGYLDAMGRSVVSIAADGSVTSTTYDLAGNVSSQHIEHAASKVDRTVQMLYDGPGRITSTRQTGVNPQDAGDQSALTTSVTYHANTDLSQPAGQQSVAGRTTTVRTDVNGGETITVIDAQGRLIAEIAPPVDATDTQPLTVRYGYTYHFADDPTAPVITLSTQMSGNGISTPRESKEITNLQGQTLAMFDPQELLLRPTREENADAEVEADAMMRYVYDKAGRVIVEIDPQHRQTTYRYDARHGHVVETKTPQGAVTSFGYDSAGQLIREQNPQKARTVYLYDELGRKTVEVSQVSLQVAEATTAAGKQVLVPLQKEMPRTWVFDGLATIVTDRDGLITVTEDDPVQNQVRETWYATMAAPPQSLQDLAGETMLQQVTLTSNTMGQPIVLSESSEDDSHGSTITVVYDGLGRANRQLQDFDAFGKSAPTVRYDNTYFDLGQRKTSKLYLDTVPDASTNLLDDILFSSTTFQIDNRGRIIGIMQDQETASDALWNGHEINETGSVGEDKSVIFRYRADGKLTQVSRRTGLGFDDAEYATIAESRGTTTYEYGVDGRIMEIHHRTTTGTESKSIAQYRFDAYTIQTGDDNLPIRGEDGKILYGGPGASESFFDAAGDVIRRQTRRVGGLTAKDGTLYADGQTVIDTTEQKQAGVQDLNQQWAYRYDEQGNRLTELPYEISSSSVTGPDGRVLADNNYLYYYNGENLRLRVARPGTPEAIVIGANGQQTAGQVGTVTETDLHSDDAYAEKAKLIRVGGAVEAELETPIQPGVYGVHATWKQDQVHATIGRFTVSVGAGAPEIVKYVDFRQQPNQAHVDGVNWLSLGTIDIGANGGDIESVKISLDFNFDFDLPPNPEDPLPAEIQQMMSDTGLSVAQLADLLENSGDRWVIFDTVKLVRVEPEIIAFDHDHRQRLESMTEFVANPNGPLELRKVEYIYDALDRRIASQETRKQLDGNNLPTSQDAAVIRRGYVWDGATERLVLDLDDSAAPVLENRLYGADGALLATDIAEGVMPTTNVSRTIWNYEDAVGTVRTVARFDSTGNLILQHRHVDSFGELFAIDGDATDDGLVAAPWVFAEMLRDAASANLQGVDAFPAQMPGLYNLGGRWYDLAAGKLINGSTLRAVNPLSRPVRDLYGPQLSQEFWASIAGPDAYGNELISPFNRLVGESVRSALGDQLLANAQGWQLVVGTVAVSVPAGFAIFYGSAALGPLAAAGLLTGGVNGGLQTYAAANMAGREASYGEYGLGIIGGALGGAVNPYGAFAGLGLGLAGGAGEYLFTGGQFFGTSYLVSSTVGDILGGGIGTGLAAFGRHGGSTGARLLYASKAVGFELGGAAVGAGVGGYAAGGDVNGFLIGAGFGSAIGGLAGARFVKCFVAGTPVLVAVSDLPELVAAAPAALSVDTTHRSYQLGAGMTVALASIATYATLHRKSRKQGQVWRTMQNQLTQMMHGNPTEITGQIGPWKLA